MYTWLVLETELGYFYKEFAKYLGRDANEDFQNGVWLDYWALNHFSTR